MRKRLVAGNWKMNTDLNDGFRLLKDILDEIREKELENSDVHIYAPFTHLKVFANTLNGSGILLGAQNCHHETSGAYTGEISADMLASVPVGGVLVGHSERRQYFGETSEQLRGKIEQALNADLSIIYCFGETLEERESGSHYDVVEQQLRSVLSGLPSDAWQQITLAYEPVWAIGTGKTATAEQAQEVHAHARGVLADISSAEVANSTRILYGGSVKPNNAAELFGQDDIDGGLIGGASLKADSFADIVRA
ncbi:triose-phosphate isomerase [bacterium]|jgi:triosephosphate isomerase|nr:triose-phosphate isomerase [bacterium]